MPPRAIKTIEDLIYYQYAKIIAASAGINTYAFIMDRKAKLSSGEIKMSDVLREIKMQMSGKPKACEYCQSTENLSWDHIIPRAKGGLDTAENGAWACRSCNSSKGSKGIYGVVRAETKRCCSALDCWQVPKVAL
ncbi:HNH endonuclease [Candidatus Babeliales bacterium]|nr:HNH endonuclease [Candidatus Babeliales bacterium]